MLPIALTIAGSDPSGGAGIQADLKTFHQFGVYGEAVITLLTVQNTQTVSRVEVLGADLVHDQLIALLNDVPPLYAKTGALGSAANVRTVAEIAAKFGMRLVVDPVMISKHGAALIREDARRALIEDLLPAAYLVTPNLHESANLTGLRMEDSPASHASALAAMGCARVLVKGGHARGPATDLYYCAETGKTREYHADRLDTRNTHGTGCTYSAAITAELAKGAEMEDAIGRAKRYITEAIRTNPNLGRGCGPVNHFART
jgi:hydroxymethylpyrimidine/phosphomethylpyrimidine kinase